MAITLELAVISEMENRLLAVMENIEQLDGHIAEQLHNWQVEDMNRKYPHVDTSKGESKTAVWPRSRTNTPRRRAIAKAKRSSGGQKKYIRKTRPILRPVLVTALRDRMDYLGQAILKWP